MNKEIKICKKLRNYKKIKNTKIIKGGGPIEILKGISIKKKYNYYGLKLYKDEAYTQELSLEEYYKYTLDNSDDKYHISLFDETKFRTINIKKFKTEKEKELLIILKKNKRHNGFTFNDYSDNELIQGYYIKKKYENMGLKLYKDQACTKELSLEEYYTYTAIFRKDDDKELYFYYISIVDNSKIDNIKTMSGYSMKEKNIFESFKTKVSYDKLGLKVYKDEAYTQEFTLYDYYNYTVKGTDKNFNIGLFNETAFLNNIDIIKNDNYLNFFNNNIIYENLFFLKSYLESKLSYKYSFDTSNLKKNDHIITIIINTLINLIKCLNRFKNLFGSVDLKSIDSSNSSNPSENYIKFKDELINLYYDKLKEYNFIITIDQFEQQNFSIDELFKIIFMHEKENGIENGKEDRISISNKLKQVQLSYDVLEQNVTLNANIKDNELFYTFSLYTLNHIYIKLLLQLKIMYEAELQKQLYIKYSTFSTNIDIDDKKDKGEILKLKGIIQFYKRLIDNLPKFISNYFFIDILRINAIKLDGFSNNKCLSIILFCNLLNIFNIRNNNSSKLTSVYSLNEIDFGV